MKTGWISPETSCRIANLGFVCTLMVIVIHIRNVPQEVGSLPWLTHFVVRNVFASVAVPFFFIVSGCFLGRHVGEPGWWRRALVQRMRTLGIPWFVWCLVPFLVFSVFWTAGDAGGECARVALKPSSVAAAFGFNFFTSPEANRPLWYLRELLVFALISPLLMCLLERFRLWALAAFATIYLAVNPGTLDFPGFWLSLRWQIFWVFGFSVEGLGYFSLGLYLSRHPVRLPRRTGFLLGAFGLALGLVGLALCAKGVRGWSYCISVSVPATLGFLWTLTPTTRRSGLLVGNAFAIYVMHAPLIRTIHLLGLVPAGPFAAPLEWALVTLAAGTLAWTVRRCLPKSLTDLCFGGR